MRDFLLFLHAFTGCDSVSSIYRKGKIEPFRKLGDDKHLREKLRVFNNPQASADAVADAGEAFFLSLYEPKGSVNVDILRHQLYVKTIAKQPVHAQFNLAVLPPTSAAAREHSLRAFYQVQQWRGVNLNPLCWGWKIVNGYLRPIPTSNIAAPEQLLHLVSCSCTDDCQRSCECRKSTLSCSTMCAYCVGHGYSNRDVEDEDGHLHVQEEEYTNDAERETSPGKRPRLA